MTTPEYPDPDLASELRQGAGSDWIADAAEDEQLSEIHRRRRLEMKDLITDMAHRGERVTVEYGGHVFNGVLTASEDDYAVVNGPGQIAEIRFSSGRWSALPMSDAPRPQRITAAETFLAALRQHEADQNLIRLSLPAGDVVIGKISTVSSDHVEFAEADERRIYVPLDLILGTIRSIDPH